MSPVRHVSLQVATECDWNTDNYARSVSTTIVPHDDDGRAMKGSSQRGFTNSGEIEMKAEDDSDDAGVRTRTSAAKLPTPLNDSESKAEEKTLIRIGQTLIVIMLLFRFTC